MLVGVDIPSQILPGQVREVMWPATYWEECVAGWGRSLMIEGRAAITVTIMYPKRMMVMTFRYCFHLIRASVNAWLRWLVYRCGWISFSLLFATGVGPGRIYVHVRWSHLYCPEILTVWLCIIITDPDTYYHVLPDCPANVRRVTARRPSKSYVRCL